MRATLSIGAALLTYFSANALALPRSTTSEAQAARTVPNPLLPRSGNWCVTWYTDHDCKEEVGSECSGDGAPPRSCSALGFQDSVDIYSVKWEPAGRTLYVANNEDCGDQGEYFGPDEGGCQEFYQNVNPVKSFSVA
ncbi:hypothetical protein K469DRAFT_756658 [Zopfia rhizophila CBS 207.26]|uniref:Small secreted protein n=1 Tax=Zopfia rhizophila CBS 207.26 TaxID=1314779 RepID=A0A6A6D8W4_9PEZI|nr:hypothetical protein K469DRAFT_756658 [Zopfia rhizophila CBS 207.26]